MTNTLQAVVEDLFVYPIKACAPLRVAALEFDANGTVVGDRAWVVIDAQSNVVWQGAHPKLARVHPEFQQGHLALRNHQGHSVGAWRMQPTTPCRVQLWNDTTKTNDVFLAADAGDEAAEFLEHTVGARLRLARLGRAGQRRAGSNRAHIVSRSSVEELAAEFPETENPFADLGRFRPNVVINAVNAPLSPFIEEHFVNLEWTLGTTTACLKVEELCVRCVVPNVDPATGHQDPRVLEAISKHSAARHPGKPIYFGLYATATGASTLSRGAVLQASLAF